MRQIVVDELRPDEYQALDAACTRLLEAGPVAGLFWLRLPAVLLTPEQSSHEGCGPHALALELRPDCLAAELLVRGRGRLHCSCIAYASPGQRDFLLAFLDRLLAECQLRS